MPRLIVVPRIDVQCYQASVVSRLEFTVFDTKASINTFPSMTLAAYAAITASILRCYLDWGFETIIAPSQNLRTPVVLAVSQR